MIMFTRATKFGSLDTEQLGVVKETIFSTEVGGTGER